MVFLVFVLFPKALVSFPWWILFEGKGGGGLVTTATSTLLCLYEIYTVSAFFFFFFLQIDLLLQSVRVICSVGFGTALTSEGDALIPKHVIKKLSLQLGSPYP